MDLSHTHHSHKSRLQIDHNVAYGRICNAMKQQGTPFTHTLTNLANAVNEDKQAHMDVCVLSLQEVQFQKHEAKPVGMLGT